MKLFNLNDAKSHMTGLSSGAAIKWAQIANRTYQKYAQQNLRESLCMDKAIREANYQLSRNSGYSANS